MEASTLQAPAALPQPRVSIGTPLLRFRSDEQLVALFRAGHDDAFRAIHDRYNKRLFAYARQMLPGRQDAEDALQDVFVRAYSGLRANDRDLALRAWLFRVAHNRCIDELRRPSPPPPEVLYLVRSSVQDPLAEVDLRESLRRLITDVRRLPDQQRSALLLRELGGLSYAELATSLGISIGAVKSVLVRARIALAQAAEARDTACTAIREELVGSYDRGVRPNATARRHMRDCAGCRGFRRELRGVKRQLAALAPTVGPLGFLTKALGISGGAGGGATAGGAAVVGGGGVAASTGGVVLGAGHVATLIAAAVATAGGAVEIQHTIAPARRPAAKVQHVARRTSSDLPLAPQVSQASYTQPPSYSVSVAAIQSVTAAAQKARVAALAHRATIKGQVRDSSSNGSGGGGMMGSAPASAQSTGGTSTGLPGGTALTGDGTTPVGGSGTSSSSTGGQSGSTGSTGSSGSTTAGSGSSGSGGGSTMNATNNGSSSSSAGSTSGTSTSGSSTSSTGSSSTSSGSTTTGSPSGSTSSTPVT